jgi:hypothetical protein
MFRSASLTSVNMANMESFNSAADGLVGLDAVIPGGKYDDSVPSEQNGK